MKELVVIQSKLKAPKGQYNNFGKFRYRSAEDILEAVKPLLAETECFLTLSDRITMVGERYYIEATATLTNSEGKTVQNTASAREPETKSGMDAAQITGTASSYARKYALNGLFAIDDTKDPDTDEYHNVTHKAQKPGKDIMPDAVKEMMAVTSHDGITQVWNKYASNPDIVKKGTDFYNAALEMGKKFPKP